MSRKTSKVSGGDTGTVEQHNDLRDEARQSSALMAYAVSSTSTLALLINEGIAYFGKDIVDFDGGYTPVFSDPASSSRIDVVSMDSSGTINITEGTEADSPTAPDAPDDEYPICEVYCRAGMIKINDEDDASNGYIYRDIRKHTLYLHESVAGDAEIASSTTQRYTTNAKYTKLKELTCGDSGEFRIKFDMNNSGGEWNTGYARIYRNGVAVGTEQTVDGGGNDVNKSEDIGGWNRGDLLQIYAKTQTGFTVSVNDLYVYNKDWEITTGY